MELSAEFWISSVLIGVITSSLGYFIKKAMQQSEHRHDECDEKIEKMIKELSDLKIQLAQVKTTIEILVFGKNDIKSDLKKSLHTPI